MRASVNLPTPRGPENNKVCGTRPEASIPRRAVTTLRFPRNSENGIGYSENWTFKFHPRFASLAGRARKHARFDGREHGLVYFFRRFGHLVSDIAAFNAYPISCRGELIVDQSSFFEVFDA